MSSDLVVLTRDGCVNTPKMLTRLDQALRELSVAIDYPVVSLGTLHPDDPRVGYPTPTVLVGKRDLFGMSEPVPPFPAST